MSSGPLGCGEMGALVETEGFCLILQIFDLDASATDTWFPGKREVSAPALLTFFVTHAGWNQWQKKLMPGNEKKSLSEKSDVPLSASSHQQVG